MPEVFGPEQFAVRAGVSRKTLAQLQAYAALLADWNSRHNLVAHSTLSDLWRRHVWDSAQLAPLVPAGATTLADLGSGAGFPGLVLAAMRPDLAVTLFEATGKKCAFLAAAAERMEIAVTIENARMEDQRPRPFDVISARACAPLPLLLHYAYPFTGPNSVCLFLKGQNVESELTEARKYWNVKVSQIPSLTDPSGAIVELRQLAPHDPEKTPHTGHRQSKRRRR